MTDFQKYLIKYCSKHHCTESEAKSHAPLKTGYLIVIAAKVGAHEASGTDMGKELTYALTKLNMYKTTLPQTEESSK